jgi:hypothetical protein
MNYIIYNVNATASIAERDKIWSVLLFGEKVQISTDYAMILLLARDIQYFSDDAKVGVYRYFKDRVTADVSWEAFEAEFDTIFKLRKKKMRTQLDNMNLQNKEKWFRAINTEFLRWINENVDNFYYREILPLTNENEDPKVKITWPIDQLESDPDQQQVKDHVVRIAANAIIHTNNMFVFDEQIVPLIHQQTIDTYGQPEAGQGDKIVTWSEKIFRMPLCYLLKENDIRQARNELTRAFKKFDDCIYSISEGKESLVGGMEKIRSMIPELQHKADSNLMVSGLRNRQNGLSAVDVHLAFTTNRGLLTLLKQLDQLTEEQVLQASDMIMSESSLDHLHPFIYITH